MAAERPRAGACTVARPGRDEQEKERRTERTEPLDDFLHSRRPHESGKEHEADDERQQSEHSIPP